MSRISYSQSTPFGNLSKQMINSIITAKYTAARIKPVLDAMVGTGPVDYTQIESQLGVTAGQGQAFYNLLTGMSAALNAIVGLDTLDIGQ